MLVTLHHDRTLIINEHLIFTRCLRQGEDLPRQKTERFSAGSTPNYFPIVRLTYSIHHIFFAFNLKSL